MSTLSTKVLTTDRLCSRWWLELKLRYWSVCWFTADGDFCAAVVIDMDASIEKEKFTVLFRFGGKFYVGVQAFNMFCDFVRVIFMNEYECVVNITKPSQRRVWSSGKCSSLKSSYVEVCYERGYRGSHCCTVSLFMILAFVNKVSRDQAKSEKFKNVLDGEWSTFLEGIIFLKCFLHHDYSVRDWYTREERRDIIGN